MIIFESTELKSRKIKVNRIIKYVLGLYKELIVSRRAMLTHFLAVKQKDNLDADPLNVYVDICKSKGYEIERGLSSGETAFVFGAVKLKDQEPTDVINAAFYNNTRNDTVFECGYLIEVFKKLIETDNARARIDYNVLCINPSPDMIIDLERDRSLRSRYHYSVVDDTLAQLYQIQFPTSVFVSFDRVSNLEGMDYILVTNRDYRKEKWMSLLQGLGVNSSEQAKVLMLVPSSWFDRFGSGIYDFIAEQGYCVQQILIIDSEATLSSPRKKLCVVLEKSSEQKTFILSKSRYNAKTRWFEVLEETLQIEIEEYFKTNVSIAKIWDMHLNPDQPIDNAPKYTKAKTYQYSKEIQITYRIYADRKNKYAGIVAYRKIEDVKLGTKGRQISKNIEKGLRADTEEEVMEAFERIVFDKELYPIIRTDIDKNYVKANITLTFKTIWFFCREYLLALKKYDDEYVKTLFACKNKDISDYSPLNPGEILISAIANQLEVPVEDLPYKLIDQINTIFEAAKKNRIIANNPFAKYMVLYTSRASDRQNEVRQALVKKHLSDEEEAKILQYLLEKNHNGDKEVARCVSNGLLLGSIIRLLTGMPGREVAALNWEDFLEIKDFGAYQFRISKFLDANGKIMMHVDRDNVNRFRLVPIPKLLSTVLITRKKMLIQEGIDPNDLDKSPIVITNDRIHDLKVHKDIPFCKPAKISKVSRQLLDKAEIPQKIIILPDESKELETDIYKLHGDIFLSNYKYKCNHIAGFDNGELSYVTATKPTDTFSAFYCDFSRDDQQYQMIKKLERWLYRYDISDTIQMGTISGGTEGNFEYSFGPYGEGVTMVDLTIHHNGTGPLKITICSDHGVVVDIKRFKR